MLEDTEKKTHHIKANTQAVNIKFGETKWE